MAGVRLVIEVDDKGSAKIRSVGKAHDALTNKVERGSSRMGRAVDRVRAKWAGARAQLGRFAAFGKIALAGLAVAAAITGAKFEQSMANVAAVSSSTTQELEQLTATARGLGATTAFSASQAADAMLALAQAGQSVAEIQQSVGEVLLFAGAAATDLGSSAETLVQTLAQFRLGADQSNRVVNVFAASMSVSLLNAERLREGLSQVGSTAAAVGMQLEETVAVLGQLNSAGMLGGIAGTRLKNVLVRLAAPNAVLKELLGGVSLEADGLKASMAALADADPGKIFKAFGRIAAPAVLVMRKATKELEELEKRITGTNKAQEMFETQMATVSSQVKIFKSQLQENMIATFTAARDAGFNAIGALTQKLAEIKPYIVGTVAVVVRWFQANRELVGSIARTLAIVGAVAAAIAFLTSTVGLVTAGVVAGAAVWSKYGDRIRQVVGNAIDSVVGFAEGWIESHQGAVETVLGFVKGWANTTIGLIVFMALNFFDLGKTIVQALRSPLRWVVDRIKGLIDFAGPVFEKLGIGLGKTFAQITDDLKSEANEQQNAFGAAGRAIADNAETAFGTDYVGAVAGGIQKATAAGVEKLGALKNKMAEIKDEIRATGEAAGGRIQMPGSGTSQDENAHVKAYLEERKRLVAEQAQREIEEGRRIEDERRAGLVRTVGFEQAHTEQWLNARLELLRSNYDEQLAAAGGSLEKQAELEIEQAAAVAEARKEHNQAVLDHFVETQHTAMLMLNTLGSAYDAFFNQIASGSIKAGKIREAVISSVRRTFVKQTGEMIKYWIKQQLLGLLVTRSAKDADAKKEKLQDAKAGARKAYHAFASIPFIGPALGAAAAAAAFAFLMAFQAGGMVPGVSRGRDSVPSVLEPGEYVVKRSSAQSVGAGALEYINRTGRLPGGGGGGDVYLSLDARGSGREEVDEMEAYLEDEVVPRLKDIKRRRADGERRNVS